MTLIVQKYGGTSVGTLDRIHKAAEKIIQTKKEGHDLIVVVSAMSGETDRLISLAHQLSQNPNAREFDVLLATGEQVSIALLAMALLDRGCPARSYTGLQVQIHTDEVHGKARIIGIDSVNIKADLEAGNVVIVAGFQGVNENGDITTLGRGGSDTTAVALAAALGAEECQIYTDVDGVYTTDPKIVSDAQKMSTVTYKEMLELASLGAKVMQIRAVEFAGKYNVPVRVLSSFKRGSGTLITSESKAGAKSAVSGIAFNRDEAKILLKGVPDAPGVAAGILRPIGDANIEVDMLVHHLGADGNTHFAFTVHRRDYKQTLSILESVSKNVGVSLVVGDDSVAKLSLVGVGLRAHAGIASTMFQTLGLHGVNIQLMSASEIKVSVIIDEKHLDQGVRVLHEAFQLGMMPG